jgi:hypothetical protein
VALAGFKPQIEILKRKYFLFMLLSVAWNDLLFSRNESQKSADHWCTGILKNKIKISSSYINLEFRIKH